MLDDPVASAPAPDPAIRTLSSSTSIGVVPLEEPHEGFEVDHHLHQAIGHLAINYPCDYDGTNGTLFAGSGGASFVGWTFFFQKRVDMTWENVLQVVKTHRVDCGHCITFVMRDNVEHDFCGIQHSERVWSVLVNLHNDSLHTPNKEPLVTPLRKSLRRMSTDPTYISTPHVAEQMKSSPTEAAYIVAASVASNDEFRASISSRNMAASSVASRRSLMMSHQVPTDGQETEINVDLQEAWNELQKGGTDKESYATSAIQDRVIPCSLDEFFDKFVANDALYPYTTYMNTSGDTVLEVTAWKQDENQVYKRTIEYKHPVNAPLAPPTACARKEQRYRRYGDSGLVIETDTYVEDVPMADCFYVTDRVLVEPNRDGAVVILAEFDMRFVKSTMFRSLISNTTKSEFLKWFQGIELYWSEAAAPLPNVTTAENVVARRPSSIRRPSLFGAPAVVDKFVGTMVPVTVTWSNRLLILLLILVLIMQSWLTLEMLSVKRAMTEMESRLLPFQTCPTLKTN